jgi:hypothetical protein
MSYLPLNSHKDYKKLNQKGLATPSITPDYPEGYL